MNKNVNEDVNEGQEILLTGKGLLLTTLLLPHEEGDKVIMARELVYKRLTQNGLRQKDIGRFSKLTCSEIPFLHPWVGVAQIIQTLASNVPQVAEFVDWVYELGYWSDEDGSEVLEDLRRLKVKPC